MGKMITVDPVTRIEGHLGITVEVEDGKVKDAWSRGTMARGFEALLQGRDPRDASFVTSRFCGVCYSVHQMASVRALDAAFGAKVLWGGTLLRNLAMGAEYIYNHILHFYHLAGQGKEHGSHFRWATAALSKYRRRWRNGSHMPQSGILFLPCQR